MGKLEDLKRSAGANAGESMGQGRPAPVSGTPAPFTAPARLQGVTKARDASEIPVAKIERDPGQPREEFDPESLERLAESMKARGQLQPIRVRWDEGRGAYLIVCGERRWRAARMAGLATLTAIVCEAMAPGELLAVQLVENALREDLKPVEQARAYRRVMDAQGWSVRQLSRELSIDHARVLRALALLQLPPEVQAEVDQGLLAASSAAEIARLPAEDRAEVARAVVDLGVTRADLAEFVQAKKSGRPTPAARPGPVTVKAAGTVVTVRWQKGGEGTTAVQALRAAIRELQERERQSPAA